MGSAKRAMEHQEALEALAIGIAIDAGVLQKCENHEETIYADSGDVSEAVDFAKNLYRKGKAKQFESEDELIECIRSVVQEHSGDECVSCDHSEE